VASTLLASLRHPPGELKFGTSGRRGTVASLTQLEIYLNVLGELRFLQSLPLPEGGITPGDEFYIAHDLRPSSTRFDAAQGNRGEICQAVAEAVRDAGMRPVHAGAIPTPALACFAWARGKGSIMVTGSHIPFDWNGYKLNTSRGELLKSLESPVGAGVAAVRTSLYSQPAADSKFDRDGRLKAGHADLGAPLPDVRVAYVRRYTDFFDGRPLAGMRVLLYEHSAVGRDLLREILEALGAAVVPAGRSDTFVPIDTEAIDETALAAIQKLADAAGPLDAIVSTDGDSDRPLILGLDPDGKVRFFPGDVVGMIVAEFLGADAVVVPISCNDAIDRGRLAPVLEPKTRIGSPHVIAGMDAAHTRGRHAVCGWEANGGFLTGSDIVRHGRTLSAQPTRDAVLPILAVLSAARERGLTLGALFAELPPRFTVSTLIRDFPRPIGLKLVAEYPPANFEPVFGPIAHIDRTDGLRIAFLSGDVLHLRPSGNADEFRIYACADTRERAAEITRIASDALSPRAEPRP
jgi:phosphomannomutase